MDETFHEKFQEMQGLDAYWQHGNLEDMPLSDEFLGDFGLEFYEATAPGGLPSPNSSNPEVSSSSRESPVLPSLSPFTGAYGSQSIDASSGAHNAFLSSDLLQQSVLKQSQQSCTNTDSNMINEKPSTNPDLSNETINSSKTQSQQGKPSVTGSSCTDAAQYQSVMTPPENSLCVTFQGNAATVPPISSVGQISPRGRPISTHVSIAPKVNNTSSASVPASAQHSYSPTLKSQHSVRYPSHLRNQIHPDLLQYSPFTMTATDRYTTGQPPHTMSSTSNFTDHQELSVSPSQDTYQNVPNYSSNRLRYRQITNAHNLSQASPVLQNVQPFHESNLRSSVASALGQDYGEVGQTSQYPDLQSSFQQQSSRSPYMGHHYVSGSQGNSINSYSPEQYPIQASDSRNPSLFSQVSTDFVFNGSSPLSIQHQLSPPSSDHAASTPTSKSRLASPKPQKKRRVKQEPRDNDDGEGAVDPIALQTADLTNLDPSDHNNVAKLINAMHNTDNVEDNAGMQKTWEKLRKAKAFRIKEVCVDLLNLTKRAQQQNGTPLAERRSIHPYPSFRKRFNSLCETLMFQKTVCKHLIEPPYSYGVVADPTHAQERVRNNRRVNLQKAAAIRLGREHLGEKGQGKGKPMIKTKKRGRAQLEDSQDDEENFGDEPPSDSETGTSPHVVASKPARLNQRPSKRTKRSTKSIPDQEPECSIQASYSPQVQDLGDPFTQDLHQNAYSPIQQTQMLSEHGRTLPRLAGGQRMPTLNRGFDFQSGNGSGIGFYGDNSTAGSDSDGVGIPGCEYN